MIDFGNHYCVAQIRVLSLGTCCPSRDPSLLVSCSPVPHHVIPEGPLEEHGRNFEFELSPKDMETISGLNKNQRTYEKNDPDDFPW